MGSGNLWIAVVDCGGANDQVLSLHTFRQVADDHGDAQRPQMLHRRALLHIRARNHQALALKNLPQVSINYLDNSAKYLIVLTMLEVYEFSLSYQATV